MIPARYKIQFFRALTKYFPNDFDCRVTPAEADYQQRGMGFLVGKQIMQDLIRFEPDIVYTDYPAHPTWYAKIYSLLRARRVPIVALLRGDFWTEHSAYFKTASFPTKLAGPLDMFAWSSGLKLSNRILAICGWLMEIVTERFPEKKIGVMHEGMDPEPWITRDSSSYDFKRPAVGILQDNNILPKVKGLVWFANVVSEMQDVNFYIAGGGRYTSLVEKAFAGLQNAHMVGRVPYPDGVRRFHRSTSIYVLPSGLDCCPATLLEASLCERPVVASNVGGIPELVMQNQTGWTLPNGPTSLWVEKIRVLLKDVALSKRMGSQGRRFVLENFSWETQALKLAAIFREELDLR